MVTASILLNGLFLVLLGSYKTRSRLRSQLVVLCWVALNVGFFYYLTWAAGETSPYFSPLYVNAELPIYVAVCICISLLMLSRARSVSIGTADFTFYVVVYWFSFFMHPQVVVALCSPESTEQTLRGGLLMATVPMLICLLTPLAAFCQPGISPFRQHGIVSFGHAKKHGKVLIRALMLYLGVLFVTNVFKYGQLIHLYLNTLPLSLLVETIMEVFFVAMMQHFVCFALPKFLMVRVFGDDDMFWGEVLLLAALYVGLFHQWPLLYIIKYFLIGLILAYVYLRTGSLSYGIIACALTQIFTV